MVVAPILKFAASVYLIGFAVFGVALWLGFGSDYMGREMIAQAVRASQFLLSLNQGRELFAMLALLVVPVVGWWWFCPGVFFTGLVVVEAVQSHRASGNGMRGPAACSCRDDFGIGYLLVDISCGSRTSIICFPFLLMVIAWFVPEIFERVREFGPSAKGAVIGYCLAPAVLLGGMLWSKQPPIIFQQLMGVNLSTGGIESEVNQGQWLLRRIREAGTPVNLYSLGSYGWEWWKWLAG